MSNRFNGFSQEEINKLSTKDKARKPGIRRLQQPEPKPDENENNHPLRNAVHFKPLPPKIVPAEDKASLEAEGEPIASITPPPEEQPTSPFRGISLKDFEQHRRLMEEQNRQKVQMLQRAIDQHAEKTAAEQRRLAEVKQELCKLDSELAADVAILRKQIETATLQYNNVQKNYNTIEQMFLKAKMDLHQACEKKELLTEHLCTIIAHNEQRKAQRLSELMERVGLSTSGDSCDAEDQCKN